MTIKSENPRGLTGSATKEELTIDTTTASPKETAAAHRPKQKIYIRPAIAEDRFGLIQESIANNLYHLCVQAILWNQTTGRQARPVFEALIAQYPNVEALADAELAALTAMLNPIGLHNIRAKRLIDMAKTWTESPPSSEFVRARKAYPLFMPGDEKLEKEFEIVHLPGMGPYALDSYRIFHRDQLRGLAKDWNGKGAPAGFEPEWKRVLPLDKDLRVFLEWMWRREDFHDQCPHQITLKPIRQQANLPAKPLKEAHRSWRESVGKMKAASPELVATFERNPSSKCLDFIRTSSNVLFSSCKWSPDGTTIVAADSDSTISTLILPPTLLEANEPQTLETYAQQKLPGPCHSLEIYPQYSLTEPSTALFLASPASLPIRLLSLFSPSVVASYPIINATTEEYLAPHSLLFDPRDSSQFFAGTDSLICVFDVNRNGQEPLAEIKTIPSRRKKIVGGGVGMKGIVSTMCMNGDGLLATGTFTRWIGLYDGGRQSDSAAYFQLGRNQGDEGSIGEGAGVSQLLWTDDGRYLIVNERGSTGLGVWDIRGTGQRLCWLNGRDATTMQRTQVTLQNGALWAGCDDGSVRIWNDIGQRSDLVEPDQSLALGNDTISSALLHPGGSVLATCEGTRQYRETLDDHIDESDEVKDADGRKPDQKFNDSHGRIKIWALSSS